LYEKRWYTSKGPQEFTSLYLKKLKKKYGSDNPHVGVTVTIYCWDLLAYKLISGKPETCFQIDLFLSPLFLIIP
jgi:hypothetical protein